MPLLDQLTRA